MKSFRQLIVEAEKEHLYVVLSTEDIHTAERMSLIKLAAIPHQCFGVEADYKRPTEKANKDFPGCPNSPSYAVKVWIGLPCDPRVLELEIKSRLNFRKGELRVEADDWKDEGAIDPDHSSLSTPSNSTPSDTFKQVADGEPQKMVGTGRLGEFMKEIEKDRAQARKDTETRDVYESFAVSPDTVAALLGEAVRRGYYVVEQKGHDIQIDGPFAAMPQGFAFKASIVEGVSTSIRSKSKVDGHDRYEVVVLD